LTCDNDAEVYRVFSVYNFTGEATDRQTDSQASRQAGRQAGRQTEHMPLAYC